MQRSTLKPQDRQNTPVSLYVLLLCIVLTSVFAYQNDHIRFLPQHHGFLSSHGMALVSNISLEHDGLMFSKMTRDPHGDVQYEMYNRFPIGAFLVIKALVWPFASDFDQQYVGAQIVIKLFFILAVIVAFLILLRLSGSAAVAFCASLAGFSSLYLLYYSDMVFNDIPALFGCMLAVHGMVVYQQERRFAQLAVKALVAVSLGWQVYAFCIPFVLFGLLHIYADTRSLRAVVMSRYVLFGVIVLTFGLLVLAANFTGEYLMTGLPLTELPTFHRMMWRFGISGTEAYFEHEAVLSWGAYLADQANKVGRMAIPALSIPDAAATGVLSVIGALMILGALVIGAMSRHRIIWMSLVLPGIIWALIMRHFVAFHDFQSIYYVGIPLMLYYYGMRGAMKISRFSAPVLVGLVAMVFVMSSVHINVVKYGGPDADGVARTADFQHIAHVLGTERRVFVAGDNMAFGCQKYEIEYYLAHNYLQPGDDSADFIVSPRRIPGLELLTPSSENVFLYRAIPQNH